MTQFQNTTTEDTKIFESLSFNETIVESIREIKGKDIVLIDLRELHDRPTEFFIICSGDSHTQIKAIAENIHSRVKEFRGEMPYAVEGKDQSKWILMDYFSTVVHIFHPGLREFYELEELWSDGRVTEYENDD